jgi:FMN phosphatase YigB (HAD superfamily)
MSERWLTFDCYGTLIDWETGIGRGLQQLWPTATTTDNRQRAKLPTADRISSSKPKTTPPRGSPLPTKSSP